MDGKTKLLGQQPRADMVCTLIIVVCVIAVAFVFAALFLDWVGLAGLPFGNSVILFVGCGGMFVGGMTFFALSLPSGRAGGQSCRCED